MGKHGGPWEPTGGTPHPGVREGSLPGGGDIPAGIWKVSNDLAGCRKGRNNGLGCLSLKKI